MLPARRGLRSYVGKAFRNRWNLLAFFGALAFAVLSGRPDITVPLVLAGELAYVGLVATNPKFQNWVDVRGAQAARQAGAGSAEQSLRRILLALPPRSLQRFEDLRARCRELRQIALEIKDPSVAGGPFGGGGPAGGGPFGAGRGAPPPLDELQVAGLDRLLWIYLRLLFTEYSLERFLQKTGEGAIESDIAGLEERLRQAAGIADELQRQKVQRTIEDNLQTCRDRLANYRKARDNYELVQLELSRLENKIRTLAELAVNRQEPDFITTQVDQVASSMLQTERTMNELQFATGLELGEDVPPALLQRQAQTGGR